MDAAASSPPIRSNRHAMIKPAMTPKGNNMDLSVIGGMPSPTKKAHSKPMDPIDHILATQRIIRVIFWFVILFSFA